MGSTDDHDTEVSLGRPGPTYDDRPADFDRFDDRYDPPPADPPEEDIVHYGPGYRPLCGDQSPFAIHTDEPDQVAGCENCLELVAEDLDDHNNYLGRCLHCREWISAQGGVQWRRLVRRRCPHCGRPGW